MYGPSDRLVTCLAFSVDGSGLCGRLVTCLAFSVDGSLLATGSMDRTIKVWRLTDTSRIMYGLSGYEEPEAVEQTSVELGHGMEGFSIEDVAQWLTRLGMAQYQDAFQDNAIDGKELLALTASDLETHLGVGEWCGVNEEWVSGAGLIRSG
ncbi:hypothetical protein ACOMHN_048108 [Nucella lapillus]